MGRTVAPLPLSQGDENCSELSSITSGHRAQFLHPLTEGTSSPPGSFHNEMSLERPPFEVLLPCEKICVVGISYEDYEQPQGTWEFCRLLLPPWLRHAPPWLHLLVLGCFIIFFASAMLIFVAVAWQLQRNSDKVWLLKEAPTTAPTQSSWRMQALIQTPQPSAIPTATPSLVPTTQPSMRPSIVPTAEPSQTPTSEPSQTPTSMPTHLPTSQPTAQPSLVPTFRPSNLPSSLPSVLPTLVPTGVPSNITSIHPSRYIALNATLGPNVTESPLKTPTLVPSAWNDSSVVSNASFVDTPTPSPVPSAWPSPYPSAQPSLAPSPRNMMMNNIMNAGGGGEMMNGNVQVALTDSIENSPTNFPTFARGERRQRP